MPRRARLVLPDYPHHVTQRGNRRGDVFLDDEDREVYLRLLDRYSLAGGLALLAYCLMSNHVHLVVVPETLKSLSRVLGLVHMLYATYFNKKQGWSGHLWQARFFSSTLDEAHMWSAIRYVERNPVRAGIVDRAVDYRWSSARGHCGMLRDVHLSADNRWSRILGERKRWLEWLGEEDPVIVESIRRNTSQGIPSVSERLACQLEEVLGRSMRYHARGRQRIERA